MKQNYEMFLIKFHKSFLIHVTFQGAGNRNWSHFPWGFFACRFPGYI